MFTPCANIWKRNRVADVDHGWIHATRCPIVDGINHIVRLISGPEMNAEGRLLGVEPIECAARPMEREHAPRVRIIRAYVLDPGGAEVIGQRSAILRRLDSRLQSHRPFFWRYALLHIVEKSHICGDGGQFRVHEEPGSGQLAQMRDGLLVDAVFCVKVTSVLLCVEVA